MWVVNLFCAAINIGASIFFSVLGEPLWVILINVYVGLFNAMVVYNKFNNVRRD